MKRKTKTAALIGLTLVLIGCEKSSKQAGQSASQTAEPSTNQAQANVARERIVRFPGGGFSGELFVRDRTSDSREDWRKLPAPTRGIVTIPDGKHLRLKLPGFKKPDFSRLPNETLKEIDSLALSGNVPVFLVPADATGHWSGLLPISAIRDDDLADLKQFTALRDLDLMGANISARGLRHLRNLRSLEHLNLYYVQIGDEAVPFLRRMTNLKSLVLIETHISAQGAAQLRQALPNCKISWQPHQWPPLIPTPAAAERPLS